MTTTTMTTMTTPKRMKLRTASSAVRAPDRYFAASGLPAGTVGSGYASASLLT
jgi:hypothetical protein